MANGNLVNDVDELLEKDRISQTVASKLILKMLKNVYEKLDDLQAAYNAHEDRIRILEEADRTAEVEKKELINWTWIRDNIVQPLFMLLIGILIAKIL